MFDVINVAFVTINITPYVDAHNAIAKRAPFLRKPGMSIRVNGLMINQSVGGYIDQIVKGSG